MKNLLGLLLSTSLLFSCQPGTAEKEYLGTVTLAVQGKEEALAHFERGLLLLHSFEYADAREAFQLAQSVDPAMAMAYWGEAMTYNHSLWGEQAYGQAEETLTRLQALSDPEALSPLEKDFIRALEILYQPDTPKPQRDKAYADFMKKLAERYPNNQEVAALYALALLGSVPEGRDVEIYEQAAGIARQVVEANPQHPGALHYLIHAYDDPEHARLALDAAYAYAKVAPDASHALHMPSHIFVALGMWQEVVNSNIDSYQASLHRMERKSLDNDARGYHAFHWLQYGYLQMGKQDKARKMLQEMVKYAEETPSKRARTHLVLMKGTYLVESRQWNSAFADIPVATADLNIATRSQFTYLEGMKAFQQGQARQLTTIIRQMEEDIASESLLVNDSIALCTDLSREAPTLTDIQEAQVMVAQLQALQTWLQKDNPQTERLLQQAVALEERMSYSYGPPVIPKPSTELYADWLLKQGKPAEALQQYERTLSRATNRRLASGGRQAAKQQLALGSRSKNREEKYN